MSHDDFWLRLLLKLPISDQHTKYWFLNIPVSSKFIKDARLSRIFLGMKSIRTYRMNLIGRSTFSIKKGYSFKPWRMFFKTILCVPLRGLDKCSSSL